MKVLVVEDDVLIAMTICDMLTQAGHSVVGPVSTAGAALEWAWAELPDFALINIDLADQHKGTDLARTLRRELGVNSYFVSGNLTAAKEAADASLGFISKPCSQNLLRESLEVAQALMDGVSMKSRKLPDGLVLFKPLPGNGRSDDHGSDPHPY
jgi:two-component system, response regulator PdtaR